ncbi:MAG: hypothetical protein LBF69_03425 [Prevotellaceae bacterium]|nr:hypothetical protein [Prevotellaceae bacterium]
MHSTEDTSRGVKHSNAAGTEAPDSGNLTISKDWESIGWLSNGLNVLLAMSILEIGHLTKEDAADVQYVAYFSQEFNQTLLRHVNEKLENAEE